jgi:hypothetical protein
MQCLLCCRFSICNKVLSIVSKAADHLKLVFDENISIDCMD